MSRRPKRRLAAVAVAATTIAVTGALSMSSANGDVRTVAEKPANWSKPADFDPNVQHSAFDLDGAITGKKSGKSSSAGDDTVFAADYDITYDYNDISSGSHRKRDRHRGGRGDGGRWYND